MNYYLRIATLFLMLILIFLYVSQRTLPNNPEGLHFKRPKEIKDFFSMRKNDGMDQVMTKRQATYQKACSRWKHVIENATQFYSNGLQHFFVWKKNSLGFCSIPKCGSTSLFKSLGILMSNETGSSRFESDRIFVRSYIQLSKTEKENLQKEDFKEVFVLARHPFRRFLSAYRSIVRHHDPEAFMVTEDILKFRTEIPVDEDFAKTPTFKEFVLYTTMTPPKEINHHWRPAYMMCGPCFINFTIIMHLENSKDDINYLLEATGIIGLNISHYNHKEKLHADEDRALEGIYDEIKMEKFYYSMITKKLLDDLYKVYQIDFELFDYTTSPFYDYVQSI